MSESVMVAPSPQRHASLLRRSVSFDDYESFPRSTHETVSENEKESWNSPPEIQPKLRVACFGVLLLGLHNAAFGSLLPHLQLQYRNAIFFGDFRILSVFLAPMVGLTTSGLLSICLHRRLGIQGVLTLASVILTLSYIWIALRPQYFGILLVFSFSGFGYGLINTCFFSWVGTFHDAFYSLTILQTCYYAGGIVCSILTYFLHLLGCSWNAFYYPMAFLSLVFLALVRSQFKDETAQAYVFRIGYSTDSERIKGMIREVMDSRKALGVTLFSFIVTGLQVAGSSWMPMYIYSYPVKHLSQNLISLLMECTYWSGLAAGSYSLFLLSERLKSSRLSAISICLSICFSAMFFFLGRNRSAFIIIPIFFLGFFLGPLPAMSIAQASKVLPDYLHAIGISVIVSVSQVGVSVLPFILGTFLGHSFILPASVFLLFALLLAWCFITR